MTTAKKLTGRRSIGGRSLFRLEFSVETLKAPRPKPSLAVFFPPSWRAWKSTTGKLNR